MRLLFKETIRGKTITEKKTNNESLCWHGVIDPYKQLQIHTYMYSIPVIHYTHVNGKGSSILGVTSDAVEADPTYYAVACK